MDILSSTFNEPTRKFGPWIAPPLPPENRAGGGVLSTRTVRLRCQKHSTYFPEFLDKCETDVAHFSSVLIIEKQKAGVFVRFLIIQKRKAGFSQYPVRSFRV